MAKDKIQDRLKLLPSIASADTLNLGAVLDALAGWPYLHIDIEDGNFVPNITFGMKTVGAICRYARGREIQVHLMTRHPEGYLDALADCGVGAVIAHIEALDYPMVFLNRCRSLGMKAGLALNMKTQIRDTEIFWELTDQLLLMTSEPDFAGEALYEPALKRAVALAERFAREKHRIELYVDGGLTEDALRCLAAAGASGAVLGRLVFSHPEPLRFLQEL